MRAWKLPSTAPTSEIVETYNELGFVAITGLLTADDVAGLHAAHNEGVAAGNLFVSKGEMADNYDTIYRHPTFEKWVHDPRLVAMVRAIFNRGIELQHVKYNAKPLDGGGQAPWHQDYPFFPHTNYDLLALTLYFDDVDETNGALRFVPGTHRQGEVSHLDATGKFVYEVADQALLANAPSVAMVLPPGSITIHHCLTLHCSGEVIQKRERRLLIFQYRAEDNVQLAGPLWDVTGLPILKESSVRQARFPDGTTVNLRGNLIDVFGNLKPQRSLPSVRPKP